uniref:G protein-coupled receptor 119 n=1 Tax=Pelodiscus sinensis TaxID=13735 RepID=K7EX46_PELSI|nr:glucose-dependent insulinotropic receptor [Pelodiscus sinensis]|eukprot:XP_006118181.1 glucose-dependent insulinotropic receptor [Pelodiscus sinensis]
MDGFGFGVLLAVLAPLIIATNTLVAVALLQLIQKNGCQGLYFVLNLAVADFLVGITITGLVTNELSPHDPPPPKMFCILRMAFVISPSAASILTMILVAFDRYLAIKQPFQYFRIMSGLVVSACLVGLWLAACFIGFLPLLVQGFQQKSYEGKCAFFGVFQPTYMLTIFCIGFFPALSIFIYLYCDILKIASLHVQHIREVAQAGLAGNSPLPHNPRDMKAVRTVAILIGCFVLSWAPFFITSIVQVVCQECFLYEVIERYLWLLGLCNSLLNPLIYAYWQKEVRLQIYQLSLCMKRKCFPFFHRESGQRIPSRGPAPIQAISSPQLQG